MSQSNTSTSELGNNPNSPWHESEAARRECHAKLAEGEFKTQVEVAQCINPKVLDAYEKAGDLDLDLVLLIGAKRLELAEEVDAGAITAGQASVTLAELAAKSTELKKQRHLENISQKKLSPHDDNDGDI